MNIPNKRPLGVVTFSLLLIAVAMQFWPKDRCIELTESLEKGYFLHWMSPQLLLIRADKQSYRISNENKQTACYELKQLVEQQANGDN